MVKTDILMNISLIKECIHYNIENFRFNFTKEIPVNSF